MLSKHLIKLIFLSFAVLISAVAESATVKSISKKKKQVTVTGFEEGDEVKKGDKLCVYDDDGKEIACGKVRKKTKTRALSPFF